MVGTGCGKYSLELQAGHHIGIAAVTVLLPQGRIGEIKPGGEDHRTNLDLLDLIHLVVLDGIDAAKALTCLAAVIEKVHAGAAVDDRNFGHGLGKWQIDGRP
jgi:hypothetical protein